MVRVKINPDSSNINSQRQKINPIKPYEDIAEGMEANFTRMMLAEMRKTVQKESPDSPSMNYYNSLLDSERADLMAKSDSGLGVKKVILDQIVPTNLKHYQKQAQHEVHQGMMNSTKENIHE